MRGQGPSTACTEQRLAPQSKPDAVDLHDADDGLVLPPVADRSVGLGLPEYRGARVEAGALLLHDRRTHDVLEVPVHLLEFLQHFLAD
mmetsp:Transcript_19431/g.39181  ORF Transcript_19431/g.39181 Transcript_19431/m.39181 type:complete len:88 (+) Transcript_19431:83-346(+)